MGGGGATATCRRDGMSVCLNECVYQHGFGVCMGICVLCCIINAHVLTQELSGQADLSADQLPDRLRELNQGLYAAHAKVEQAHLPRPIVAPPHRYGS